MDRFSGILDTGQVEYHKIMKDKLIDRRELQVGLEVNQSRRLKMLVVNLMIIKFRLNQKNFIALGLLIN